MSVTNLSHLFRPTSVAVIGASDHPGSVGSAVMRNLLDGRFEGPVMPVIREHRAVAGVLAYPDVESLPLPPDLAVICSNAATIPTALDQLGRRGTKAAIILDQTCDRTSVQAVTRSYGLRILGGNSLGLMVPAAHLNASMAHASVCSGHIAFISQSNAMCSTILDWARPRGIGFSHFVSLGDGTDIDFGDMLDYLANNGEVRAILLYIQTLGERRNFVPAARAAARNKPLLLIKADRGDRNRSIGAFLSEALAAPDEIFDAVARRAGALRVEHMDELFAAVETLARNRHTKGDRLAILCNGGGTVLMATDELRLNGGAELAQLTSGTLDRLKAALTQATVIGNPIDLGPTAGPKQYADALVVLADTDEIDAVLVIHAPTFLEDGIEIARAVTATHRNVGGALLTCWLGRESAEPARRLFSEAGLPTYETLGHAVRGFNHLVNFHRNQEMLLETPPSGLEEIKLAREAARPIIERTLLRPDGFLSDPDARKLLAAYGIPVIEITLAANPIQAAEIAERIGYPVGLTYSSPDVPRKWDVGGVALNLENGEAVRTAAEAILRRVSPKGKGLRFDGFGIQRMALRPHARQLMIGIACDPLFGPILVFGEGGRAVEVVRDHALALPPLNRPLAHNMIAQTRVARRLNAHGIRPAADLDAIADALVRLSCMLADNPEIIACDINPLFADEHGVLAVDARIQLAPLDQSDRRRASILSYPGELEEITTLRDGTVVVLRPIRPEDEPAHAELLRRMTEKDLRYRFFGIARMSGHQQLARLTQIDYDREMAFIASREVSDRKWETQGVVRTVTDPDNLRAELAILVRSDMKGTGLGTLLMNKIIGYHRMKKTREIVAQTLSDNIAMLALARKCGFTLNQSEDPEVTEYVLLLSATR